MLLIAILLLGSPALILGIQLECPPGTYLQGPSGCVKCKRGMYSNEIGALSPRACKNCAGGTYAMDSSSYVACPANTDSPAGAFGPLECTPRPGHFSKAGEAGRECPANFYCMQGTTLPTPCPPGTISPPRSSGCVPGVQTVIVLDWVFGTVWILLFFSGVMGLGLFKQTLSPPKAAPSLIQIQIVR
jgi:hypothetical protein